LPQPWFPPDFRVFWKPGSFWVSTVATPAVRENPVAVPLCVGCQQRDARIAKLVQEVALLKSQVQKLGERARRNASNTSIPPSANPPDAPKPTTKKPTGRKRGGQPGHAGHTRELLPPERVQHTIPFLPLHCEWCEASLPESAGPNDPEPTRHQYAELPKTAAVVTEYQGHARACPCCGHLNRALIPEDLRRETIGPRLAATLSYLSGSPHVSKRGIEELCETVFQVPISLGTIHNLEQEMSEALKPAHIEAQQAVQQAPVKHLDETGWKQAGRKRWLWGAASATAVCFVIHARRGVEGLRALLDGVFTGLFVSDRWPVYHCLPIDRRQVCWAHLKRDFQKLVDRGGPSQLIGERCLDVVLVLFEAWHAFRRGQMTRRQLQRHLDPTRLALRTYLEEGARCPQTQTANFCQNLLDVEPALWTFLYHPVDPTNNLIERLVRSAVLWRKIAFGSQSDNGCRFVERILTVVGTLRLQQRPVLEFLENSLRAHRDDRQPPKLIECG
jgi:transposase